MNTKLIKLNCFSPHPVPYHVGIYKELAKLENIVFNVIYEDDIGLRPVYVKEFKKEIQWDIDLLEGYPYEFVKNYSKNPMGGFFSRINLGIIEKFVFNRADVIFFQGYITFSDWLIFLLAKITRTKIIFRGEANLRGNEKLGGIKQKLKKIFLTNWLKSCDVVMYSCRGNKDYWRFYGVDDEKLLPIPCAVDNYFYRTQRKKYLGRELAIKEELGIVRDDFVVLFVAKINKNKNAIDLIKAVESIKDKNITILLVGDGPQKEYIEKYCLDNNIKSMFLGFKNTKEISKFFSISDLFVLISSYDYSPKAMNEAMNFELPLICTSVAGTAKDLVTNENGFLIDVGDIKGLAEKIDFLNKNRTIAKEMGRKSLGIVNDWTFEKDAFWINKAIEKVMPNTK